MSNYSTTTVRIQSELWGLIRDQLKGSKVSASEVLNILLYRWVRDQGWIKKDMTICGAWDGHDPDGEFSLERRVKNAINLAEFWK